MSFFFCSDEVRALGFTVLVDMRGATWSTVKPILKALHEHFPPGAVHQALIVKPDNFWQKQRTSLGSHKYKFEVSFLITATYNSFISFIISSIFIMSPCTNDN